MTELDELFDALNQAAKANHQEEFDRLERDLLDRYDYAGSSAGSSGGSRVSKGGGHTPDLAPSLRLHRIEHEFLTQEVGVDSLDITLRDGSGISAKSLVTPRAFVRILEYKPDFPSDLRERFLNNR